MKKILFALIVTMAVITVSCGNTNTKNNADTTVVDTTTVLVDSITVI
jgi:ABC-type Zn uptake system ZnuABC Zn-binding protein ZnuA